MSFWINLVLFGFTGWLLFRYVISPIIASHFFARLRVSALGVSSARDFELRSKATDSIPMVSLKTAKWFSWPKFDLWDPAAGVFIIRTHGLVYRVQNRGSHDDDEKDTPPKVSAIHVAGL